MNRSVLVLALLHFGTPAIGAENSPQKPGQSTREAMPANKEVAGAERKPVERKAGKAKKNFLDTTKPPLPALETKSLGLGCAAN